MTTRDHANTPERGSEEAAAELASFMRKLPIWQKMNTSMVDMTEDEVRLGLIEGTSTMKKFESETFSYFLWRYDLLSFEDLRIAVLVTYDYSDAHDTDARMEETLRVSSFVANNAENAREASLIAARLGDLSVTRDLTEDESMELYQEKNLRRYFDALRTFKDKNPELSFEAAIEMVAPFETRGQR